LNIDNIVDQLENFLDSQNLIYIDLIPLVNFHLDSNEVKLSNNIKIRKISNKEKSMFYSSTNNQNFIFKDSYEYVL
jgi:hypothetical protein